MKKKTYVLEGDLDEEAGTLALSPFKVGRRAAASELKWEVSLSN